jgi:hypothetical protein
VKKTLFVEKRGSQRAVEMLIARFKGEVFETEMFREMQVIGFASLSQLIGSTY